MTNTNVLRAKISGMGSGLPEKVLTNADLEKMVDTSDEWITTRTGIKERRILAEGENPSDLCARAAQNALADAGVEPGEIDLLIVATFTPDEFIPSVACRTQELIGAKNAYAFDMNAACTGYLYGLSMGNAAIVAGQCKKALVLGADALSRFTNWEDRATCVLFGDGVGASVLEASTDDSSILGMFMRSNGAMGDILTVPDGGARRPLTHEGLDAHRNCIFMKGNEVFKIAIKSMTRAAQRVLADTGLTIDDISLVIPHQANIRIINALAERLGADMSKVYVTVQKYGNTSASSIPVAITDARQEGKLQSGEAGLFVSFGSGLTWGAAIVRF